MSEKREYSFDFDPAKLSELFAFYGVTGDSNAELLRNFVNSLYEKLTLYKKSQTDPSEQKPLNEELTCKLRILAEKSYYCVNKPPKATRLLTLDVCKVCLALFRGLNDHTHMLGAQITQAQKPEPTPAPAPVSTTDDPIAQQLAKGDIRKYCCIAKHAYPLFQLPCVQNTDDPDKKTGCRHADCETNVRKALSVRLQLNRRPSG